MTTGGANFKQQTLVEGAETALADATTSGTSSLCSWSGEAYEFPPAPAVIFPPGLSHWVRTGQAYSDRTTEKRGTKLCKMGADLLSDLRRGIAPGSAWLRPKPSSSSRPGLRCDSTERHSGGDGQF